MNSSFSIHTAHTPHTPPVGREAARGRWGGWRRELPPVLVVAGLAADYLSPPALWTIVLPLATVLALVVLRRWASAALVVVLSSWFFVPAAAQAVTAFDASRGQHRLFVVEGTSGVPGVEREAYDRCLARTFHVTVMRAGPGFVFQPSRYVKRVFWTFAELHNAMAIEHTLREGFYLCPEPQASAEPSWDSIGPL